MRSRNREDGQVHLIQWNPPWWEPAVLIPNPAARDRHISPARQLASGLASSQAGRLGSRRRSRWIILVVDGVSY